MKRNNRTPESRTNTITYGQLFDKLRDLGFVQRTVEINAAIHNIFEHRTIDNAMIVLPERDRSDLVEQFYMGSVLATLKTHHLLPETNPLLT